MRYLDIIDFLKKTHSEFLKKYSVYIDKNVNERHLEKETTYARLTLLGKAFQSAGVIDRYEEITIAGSNRNLAFITIFGDVFFFLNGGKNIIFVSGDVAVTDTFKNVTLLPYASDKNKLIFKDVLEENFNWTDASRKILDLIHENAYRKNEALNDYINNQLFSQSEGS